MSFARSLFTVSGLTLVSRVGGFVRDSLTAIFLGAGIEADAFFVAQRLPNLFRSLFAEGAFSAAFVPIYAAEQEKHGASAAQKFAGEALMLLLSVLIPLSALIMLCMPLVMQLIAPGFENNPEKFNLALRFSTITFPYLALISVTALQAGVLNARGRFGPGAAAPIAFNIVLILGLFASHYLAWPTGLTQAWAVTLSGVAQCSWLVVSCSRAGCAIPLLRPHLGAAARKLFRNIGPGAIGAGAAQINLLISTNLASGLATGAVSYLYYADRLNQLPLGIVGIAVATTLLPRLAKHIASGDDKAARGDTARAIEFSLILGLPATVGLALAAQPIIRTLFQHGVFTASDTVATAQTLQAYALGIPGFLLVKVFAASFFARHDTKTPVKLAVIAMLVNVCFSVLLLGPLRHIGIALANSLAVSVNAFLLYRALRRKHAPIGDDALPLRIKKIILCAALMAVVTWVLIWFGWNKMSFATLMQDIIALVTLIALSSLSYAAALYLTGVMQWRHLKKMADNF